MKGNPFLGARYWLSGLSSLTQPGLRRYVALPLLLNIVLLSAGTWWGVQALDDATEWIVSSLPSWLEWLYWILMPLMVLAFMLVMAYFFSAVLMLIASPFNGLLSEKVEVQAGGQVPDEDIWPMVWRTLGRELTKMAYYLPRYFLLFIITLIPVVNVVSPLLWFLFGSWVLGLQYLDYSYDNHGVSFKQMRQQLAQRRITVMGLGAVVSVTLLVPILNWFVMSAAVIGATRLRMQHFTLPASQPSVGYAVKSSDG
ncbi:sulfate transporter CysZ [Bacterioplanes sanyensis]|uniref:Sulfate transporter CysZ n=1 Tax=Bacterioplanes sanyensis TaxID=1249553 RepID=A0A222FG17_9GAMM|nr:sulfate transporter CysZ [Bacterioplanes sanyensis]ASP38025.1 sulfate transporter CysZ [Bacterioplanes sanyensis]